MKALVIVENVNAIPAKNRDRLYVVTAQNWQEALLYFSGKTSDQYIFIHENAPFDRLLKLVEEYKGNLAVYISRELATSTSLVMLSRFTSIVNRCSVEVVKDKDTFCKVSELSKKLTLIKSYL